MYIRKLRILVADGHQRMRDCITGVLRIDFDVIGSLSDGHELVNTAMSLQPDVIVADISTPGLNALAVQKRLQTEGIDIPFVFVTIDPILKGYLSTTLGPCVVKADLLSCLNAEVRSAVNRCMAPQDNGQSLCSAKCV